MRPSLAASRPSGQELFETVFSDRHGLRAQHVCGLQPLGALCHVEFHLLALLERAESVSIDSGIMDKNLLSIIHRYEAVTLFWAEPLNNSVNHSPPNLLR